MRLDPANLDSVMLWSGLAFILFLWLTPLFKALTG
jgi:hypothetical protein